MDEDCKTMDMDFMTFLEDLQKHHLPAESLVRLTDEELRDEGFSKGQRILMLRRGKQILKMVAREYGVDI